jgi:hypothetical protein
MSGLITVASKVETNGKASVVVTGTISDHGRSFPADAEGNANSKDNYEEVVMQRGTFLLDERELNSVKPAGGLNSRTCLLDLTFKATVPVALGTGAYAGISGTLRGTAVDRYRAPRYTSGRRKGHCDPQQKPPPGAYTLTMTGEGVVTY